MQSSVTAEPLRRSFFSHFVLFISVCLLGAIVPAHAQTASREQMEQDILHYVNLHRKEIGRPPLTLLPALTEQAIAHSRNMAAGKVPFGHDGFKERAANIRKVRTYHAIGENVAYGDLDAEGVVNLWLKSGGHRRNIEGDFDYTGIGIAEGEDGTLYFTQIFILTED